jgi:hypothetical protein
MSFSTLASGQETLDTPGHERSMHQAQEGFFTGEWQAIPCRHRHCQKLHPIRRAPEQPSLTSEKWRTSSMARRTSACRFSKCSVMSLGCLLASVEQRVGFGGREGGRAGARNQGGLLSRACPFCQRGEHLSTRFGYSGTKKPRWAAGLKESSGATSPPVLICPEE